MIKETYLVNLHYHYLIFELFKSWLTGMIFYILPGILAVVIFANIVVLYVPYLLYLMLVLYICLVLISLFSNKVIIETLKNYRDKSLEIDYKTIYIKLVVLSAIILALPALIGYSIYYIMY